LSTFALLDQRGEEREVVREICEHPLDVTRQQ